MFNHGYEIGDKVTQIELKKVFDHNINSGMKYSKATKTMVLVNDLSDTLYYNRWAGDVFYYTGSGPKGDQLLTNRNKRLANANEDGTEIYLIEGVKGKSFYFMGQFKLVEPPFQEKQYDENGKIRNVWVFPLLPIDDLTNYKIPKSLLSEAEKESTNKTKKLSNTEIFNRAKTADKNTKSRMSITRTFQRNPFVIEYSKRRANGICELCNCEAPFKNKKGDPYLEIHHVEWLSRGGEDTIENTVALCPNCHRKMHIIGKSSDIKKLKKLEKYI